MSREILIDSRQILTNIRKLNKKYGKTEYLGLLYLHMINNFGQNHSELSEIIPLVDNPKLRERLQYLISEHLWQAMRLRLNSVNYTNIVEYWNCHSIILPHQLMANIYYKIFEKAANCVKSDSVLTNLALSVDFIDKTSSMNVSMICDEEIGSESNYTQALLNKAFNSYCIKFLPVSENEFLTSDSKYDKIILNLQYFRRSNISDDRKFYSDISDIIFKVIGRLKEANPLSRLGVIVDKDYLFNGNNKDFISYLVEGKLLEKILVMYKHRFSRGTSNCYMLVISGNRLKTEDVEFVDLSGINYRKYHMQISDSQLISDIEYNYSEQASYADYKVIKRYNYDINPYSYISISTESFRLKDFIVKSNRGRVLTAEDVEEYKSDITTKFKYLKQSDICDGIISANLTSLKYIPENMCAYTLKENSIVLAKNIKRGFAAVIHNIGDQEIIAEQNLLVLEVDTEKIDPWFLVAYLNIEEYTKLIKITKRLSFPIIENIVISLPKDKATQNTLGEIYKNKLSELKQTYMKLDKDIKDIYEDNEWFNL